MSDRLMAIRWWMLALLTIGGIASVGRAQQLTNVKQFVQQHCLDCHDRRTRRRAWLSMRFQHVDVERHPEVWEKVVRKLTARQMPPKDAPRPAERDYDAAVAWLESSLDAAAAKHPNPGRTETFRRLNRTEYQNAIRDLLALDVDVAALLPADESSHGFDNITVTDLSPTLLNRYVSAAQKISRLAVGRRRGRRGGDTFRIRPDITQDSHIEGLPLGTRGGTLIPLQLSAGRRVRDSGPADARPQRRGRRPQRAARAGSAARPRARGAVHREAAADGARAIRSLDAHLKTRIKATAGPHEVGVTFLEEAVVAAGNRRGSR